MSLRDDMIADAAVIAGATDEFAEPVTHVTGKGDAAVSTDLSAVVTVQPASEQWDDKRGAAELRETIVVGFQLGAVTVRPGDRIVWRSGQYDVSEASIGTVWVKLWCLGKVITAVGAARKPPR